MFAMEDVYNEPGMVQSVTAHSIPAIKQSCLKYNIFLVENAVTAH